MSISLNTTPSGVLPGANQVRGQRPDMAKIMAPVAKALGMTDQELRDAGRSGKSLDELATAKGVSHENLVAAIKEGLRAARPSGATGATGDLDALAERIATRVPKNGGPGAAGGPGGPRGPRPPRGGDGDGDGDDAGTSASTAASKAAAALSKALGMTSSELFTQLSSGTSLYDLATTKGVSTKSVNDLLVAGLSFDQHA